MENQFSLENYEAVIMDFDGTLVDSIGLWQEIDHIFLSHYNLEVPADLSEAINGMSFTETAIYFKKRFKLDMSVEEIKDVWVALSHDEYMKNIPFKPGAKEFLLYLKENGFKTGLATSNQAYTTEEFFKSKDLDVIDSYNYSCDAVQGKPHPAVFLNAAKNLGVPPEKCLAFEDTLEGVQAASAAGMDVISVRDKYAEKYRDKISELALFEIEDFRELIHGNTLQE